MYEAMFFTFLEPLESNGFLEDPKTGPEETFAPAPESQDPGFLRSEIHFSGVYSGLLRVFIPYDFSRVLTMNFMGFEDEVTESQVEDMAGELTNMVCGNLFSLLDKTTVYTLSSPSTQRISFQKKEKLDSNDFVLDFGTEEQQVTLMIHFEKEQRP